MRRPAVLGLLLSVAAGAGWASLPAVLPAARRVARAVRSMPRTVTRHPAPILPAASEPLPVRPATPPTRMGTTLRIDRVKLRGEAAPKSMQVIAVPVPTELGTGPVDYNVRAVGQAEILSSNQGHLEASTEPRSIVVITRVPANAAPGDLHVAEVLFQSDSTSVVVPVDLVVARVQRLVLRSLRPSLALHAGQHIDLPIHVQNLGNGVDTLDVGTEAPPAWKVEGASRVILAPGGQQDVVFTVHAPLQDGYGVLYLRVRALADSQTLAEVQVGAELLADPSVMQQQFGLNVTAGIATVAGVPGATSPAFGFRVSGPLVGKVTLEGRMITTPDRSHFDAYSMSRVGYYLDGSYLTARNGNWRATVGRTGTSFSPIFGWNAYGLGLSGEGKLGRWTFGGLAAQEQSAGRSGGLQAGGRIAHPFLGGLVTASAARLEQSFIGDRKLDAGGLTYAWTARGGSGITAEGGYRRTPNVEGVAGSLALALRGRARQLDLYAGHAPGGTAGFARATDEFNGAFSQNLGQRWGIRSFGYSMYDQPAPSSIYRTHGITAGPSLQLASYTTVDLALSDRVTSFEGIQGTSENTERLATVTGRALMGSLSTRLSVAVGRAGREQTDTGGNVGTVSGGRMIVRGGADYTTSRGLIQFDASLEKNQAVIGQIPTLGYVSVQGTSIRIPGMISGPRLDIGVWKNIYQGAPTGMALRLGTEARLPAGLMLTALAERNPYVTVAGRTAWTAIFKIERGVTFAPFRRVTSRGAVYDDLDANGRRDPGEPGIGGMVVRNGERTTVTRPDGSFKFYENLPRTSVPQVEAGSLTLGQVAPILPRDTTRTTWELPVVATRRFSVRIVPTADTLGRVPTTPLSDLAVMAADSSGAIWLAHADTAGLATFDALPPGHYTISLDLSRSTERLRSLRAAPTIEISTGGTLEELQMPIGFRATRIFDGSSPTNGGGRR